MILAHRCTTCGALALRAALRCSRCGGGSWAEEQIIPAGTVISSTRTADRRFAVVEVISGVNVLAHSDIGPPVDVGTRVALAGERDGTFSFTSA